MGAISKLTTLALVSTAALATNLITPGSGSGSSSAPVVVDTGSGLVITTTSIEDSTGALSLQVQVDLNGVNVTSPMPLTEDGGVWVGLNILSSNLPAGGDDYIWCNINDPTAEDSEFTCVDGHLDNDLNVISDD
jgi:hypothetical protein